MARLKWSVSNFKSLTDVAFELRQLTVITGANSSGKSSLLQSLLMLGQSAQSVETVVLNGPLVRLGQGEDVIRDLHDGLQISLRVSDRVDADLEEEIEVEIGLGIDGSTGGLTPVSVFAKSIRDSRILLEASTSRVNAADHRALKAATSDGVEFLKVATIGGRRAPSRAYLALEGLFPAAIAFHRNQAQLERDYQTHFKRADVMSATRTRMEFLAEVNALATDVSMGQRLGELAAEVGDLRLDRLTRRPVTLQDIQSVPNVVFDAIVKVLAERRGPEQWAFAPITSYGGSVGMSSARLSRLDPLVSAIGRARALELRTLTAAVDELNRLAYNIRYVGPLRDEPKVLNSSWDLRHEALPVGTKGDLTAEVLTTQRNFVVSYWDWKGRRHDDALPDAVSRWAKYLGIGEKISVLDRGKLGRQVTLTLDGAERDLTTIGVGASQLLPVLVACLVAEPESFVLIEQPELHLHPAVQSRLADFFIFARPDIGIIVETHSEYLVTRLRRRVAEEQADPEVLQVLFAEQRDGATQIRTLVLNSFGDFDVWPQGFFDAQDEESQKIIAAVATRLRKDRG